MTFARRLVFLLFFLSGFAALVYEVTWLRKLELVFGTTTYAVSSVLAVFFTGLALGSFIFGRLVDKKVKLNPLFLYGLMELGVGAYALGTPWLFRLIETLQAAFWKSFSPTLGGFSLFTILLAFLGLTIPTVLLGGTLPVISKFWIQKEAEVGIGVGALYFINTAGAVLGALAAGFWLMATLGVNQTIWIAALVSLLVGGAAVYLSQTFETGTLTRVTSLKSFVAESPLSLDSRVILIAFALAGFAALALEVFWTRLLVMVIGGSVYAFSLVLVAFLVGIALGAAAISRFTDRLRNPLLWFAGVELAIGISILLLTPLLGNLPFWFLNIYQSFGQSFARLQFGLFLLVVSVMLLPTLLMGAAFPMVVKALREKGLGDRVGRVYSVNTIGGVFGSLAAGFWLIPQVGIRNSIFVAAITYLLIGVGILFKASGKNFRNFIISFLVLSLTLIFLSRGAWDKHLLSAGLYIDPEVYQGLSGEEVLKKLGKLAIIYEAEGISAQVTVKRSPDGVLSLQINGKTDASTDLDMETQLLLGHLPLFFHPNPKEILVVGLGSGITLGAVLAHPVEQVEAVEIEEKVIEAAHFFNDYSNQAMLDPRVNLIVADGRYLLLAQDKKYDVITSEPSNPWISGSSKLFTREYFRLLKKGIKDDGLVIQWINLYALDLEGLKRVIAAFREVFPQAVAFGMATSNDLALIGASQPLELDYRLLSQRLREEEVRRDLAKIGLESPFEILAYFVLDGPALAKLAGGSPANTDSHPYVEFSAPQYLYSPVTVNPWQVIFENLSPIAAVMAEESIADNEELAEVVAKAQDFRRARILTQVALVEKDVGEGIRQAEAALAVDGVNPAVSATLALLYFENGSSFLNQSDFQQAVASFSRSLELKTKAETYVNLGLAYEGLGDKEAAKASWEQAVGLDESFELAHFKLGEAALAIGDLNRAIEAFGRVAEINPKNKEVYLYLGNLYLLRRDFGQAEKYLKKALELDPKLEEAKELLRAIP